MVHGCVTFTVGLSVSLFLSAYPSVCCLFLYLSVRQCLFICVFFYFTVGKIPELVFRMCFKYLPYWSRGSPVWVQLGKTNIYQPGHRRVVALIDYGLTPFRHQDQIHRDFSHDHVWPGKEWAWKLMSVDGAFQVMAAREVATLGPACGL